MKTLIEIYKVLLEEGRPYSEEQLKIAEQYEIVPMPLAQYYIQFSAKNADFLRINDSVLIQGFHFVIVNISSFPEIRLYEASTSHPVLTEIKTGEFELAHLASIFGG